MKLVSTIFVLIVVLAHTWFLVLEMFLWQHPIGLKTFGLAPDFAGQSAVLAANQGLYNGLLAAGLLFSLWYRDQQAASLLKRFLLVFVVVAGVYGAFTAKFSILFVQALPAVFALLSLSWAEKSEK